MTGAPPPAAGVRDRDPRQARSRATRERLLAAGERLFAERGFDGTGIAELARSAGCATGVFYQRFRDKEDLFAAVQERFIQRNAAALTALTAEAFTTGDDNTDPLSEAAARLVDWFRDNQAILRSFLHFGITHETAAGRLNALNGQLNTAVCRIGARLDPPAAADRLVFATQAAVGTLVHALLHDPGPVMLDDPLLPDRIAELIVSAQRRSEAKRRQR